MGATDPPNSGNCTRRFQVNQAFGLKPEKYFCENQRKWLGNPGLIQLLVEPDQSSVVC